MTGTVVLSRRWVRGLRVTAVVLGCLLAVTVALGAYLYALFRDLPDLDSAPEDLAAARTSIVYAADDSVIARWHGDEDRRVISVRSMPRHLRDAVVAAEDPRFYEHSGVDLDSMLRSIVSTRRTSSSTITQQLVRLLFRGRRRDITQKLREALMAYQIEGRTPKDKVLEAYLNMVYLGNGCYGVESAAQTYFGKAASGLTLDESAVLAGLIDAPGRYSPLADRTAARARRDEVLLSMRQLALVTAEEESAAHSRPVSVVGPRGSARAPYFVEYVRRLVTARFGPERTFTGGLQVHTTLDPALQSLAERAAREVLPLETDPEVAIATVEPRSGRIVAMVGGRDFAANQFDLAAQGRRQPGSAFKPFVLVAALEKGVSPNRRFATSPINIRVKDGIWRVTNYESRGLAPTLSLRAATDWSINCVYARLVMLVGPDKVVEVARRMGITSPLEANPAIALGGLTRGVSPLEMASAYGTLATSGSYAEPYALVKVTDERGKVLFAAKPGSRQVLKKEIAHQTSAMLHSVVKRGTGTAADIGSWAAGKTGTSQSYRDAWFVGYTPSLSTAVWVGYRDRQRDMTDVHGIRVAGGSFPARIWGRYMRAAQAMYGNPSPAGSTETTGTTAGGLVRVRICVLTNLIANPRCPTTIETELEPRLVPRAVCTTH